MAESRTRVTLSTRTLAGLLTVAIFTFSLCYRQADRLAEYLRSPIVLSRASRRPISVVVLFHREYETFNCTLRTWEQNGLLPLVSELVVFMNGMSNKERDSFFDEMPRLRQKPWRKTQINLINSEQNMALGLAIGNASDSAQNEVILLLEKDWALIESGHVVQDELENGFSLLTRGIADVVRLRHRVNPGIPDFSRLHSEGHEDQVMAGNKPSVCSFHMWMHNLNEAYPDVFKLCGNSSRGDRIWCTNSEYCGWTNNPVMFKKQWYRNALRIPYSKRLSAIREANPGARPPLFENWVRYESDWARKQYVVALPRGLFQHKEIGEESFFNRIYSPWRRLHNDVKGAVRSYLRTYQKNCNTQHEYGRKIRDTFPLTFISQFYFKEAMSLSEAQIVTTIRNDVDRKIEQLLKKKVGWSQAFRDLSRSWMIATLSKYPVDPVEMKITFVSHLSDSLKKGDEVKLPKIKRFCSLLNYLRMYNNVVYSTPKITQQVKTRLRQTHNWSEQDLRSIFFHENSEIELISTTIGSKRLQFWNDDANIRNWTSSAPLFRKLITPLLLREVARNSLSDKVKSSIASSTHFVWIDPEVEYYPSQSTVLSNTTDHIIRGNMWLNPMVIGNAFNSEANITHVLGDMRDHRKDLSPHPRVVSGRTIAGSRRALESFVGYYEILLTSALMKGIIPSRKALASIVSNIRGIETPIRFASFENFKLKSHDSELFIYAKNCPAAARNS